MRVWSHELFATCGGSDDGDLFPEIAPSTQPRGTVLPAIADSLGISPDTLVAVGLVDVAAAVLGSGAHKVGDACTIIGTSALNCIIRESFDPQPPDVGQTLATVDGHWIRALVNTAGTQNLDWAATLLYGNAGTADIDNLEHDARLGVDGAHGLLFHPYLSTAGVIAPFVHAGARGNLFGLTSRHTRSDVARAVFEGIALSTLDCYEAAGRIPHLVRLAGGGARSGLLPKLLADVLQTPVEVKDDPELVVCLVID